MCFEPLTLNFILYLFKLGKKNSVFTIHFYLIMYFKLLCYFLIRLYLSSSIKFASLFLEVLLHFHQDFCHCKRSNFLYRVVISINAFKSTFFLISFSIQMQSFLPQKFRWLDFYIRFQILKNK